jgi:hypothetical protein
MPANTHIKSDCHLGITTLETMQIAFIDEALRRWLFANDASRMKAVEAACDEVLIYFKEFFRNGCHWVGPLPTPKGDWSFRREVYTAAAMLALDLADLGLREAWIAAGLRPREAKFEWGIHAYSATCDFAEQFKYAIGTQLLSERASFRGTADSVIIH